MNTYATALSSLALLVSSGVASASQPALTTFDVESVRAWVASRGGDAAKTETVEVDLVFNFMKGVGCSDDDAKAAAAAAAKKANELLKGACVKVNVKEINNDWEGDGNEGAGADGEVNSTEIRKAKKDGLKEVTGPDGSGGTKKGYKVFIVKDFTGDLADTAGCTIKCEPWAAIEKGVEGISMGEILAHEIGHSFGKLDDTYDMDDMNLLMYGYVKPGSPRTLGEGEGDKIRKGAKNHGRTVKKDTTAPEDAPKQPEPRANGGISKLEVLPVVNPAGQAVYGSITAPFIFFPGATDVFFDFTILRNLSQPDPTFVHFGIDIDGDPATGVVFGPWTGIEFQVTMFFDPLLKAEPQMQVLDLLGGGAFTAPLMAGQTSLLPDEFLPFPAPPPVQIQLEELHLGGVMPIEVMPPFIVGPEPAFVSGWVSPHPDPLQLPLPLDDPFQFPLMPDDFVNHPIVFAPGFANPGDIIPIDAFGLPPATQVILCIDDVMVANPMTDPNGQLVGFPLPLDPLIFGADGWGYNFISIKANPVGPAGTTWVEGPGAGVPCPADLNGDGIVDAADLAEMLAMWGPNPGAPGDLDNDGLVNAADLAIMLAAWGPCP